MASKPLYPVQSRLTRMAVLAGSFAPNGSSAVAAGSLKGQGFTAARTDTGKFVVTLDDVYAGLVSVALKLQLAAGGYHADLIDVTEGATTALTFQVIKESDGSASDIGPDAQTRIHFQVFLKDGGQ